VDAYMYGNDDVYEDVELDRCVDVDGGLVGDVGVDMNVSVDVYVYVTVDVIMWMRTLTLMRVCMCIGM